jgi:hypothetical protein
MKIVINVVLILLALLLGYLLYRSIEEPIRFRAEKQKRENAVIDKLQKIRTAQELYRGITGGFANDFDTLRYVLLNDSFTLVSVFGDPDDPTNTEAVIYDTTRRAAKDSIMSLEKNRLSLDDLPKLEMVPFAKNAKFKMSADTLTYQQTLVHVVEVGTKYSNFMGTYATPIYRKYDDDYDTSRFLKFGDMNKPNLSGNWER